MDLNDLPKLTEDTQKGSKKPKTTKRYGLIDRSLRNMKNPLPNRWELKNVMDTVSAAGSLTDDAATITAEAIRNGMGGMAAAVAESPVLDRGLSDVIERYRITGGLGASDTVSEIIRNADLYIRSEQTFFEDIRLTELLLASTDLAQIASNVGSHSIVTLLADLHRVADTVRHTFEIYSITPEQFSLKFDLLDQSQLDVFIRQATNQLWEDVERRGWTNLPSPKPSSTNRTEMAQELPLELQEILAKAPPDQANAFKRLWRTLSSPGANTVVTAAVVVVTLASMFAGVSIIREANTKSDASSSAEVNVGNIQGDVHISVINTSIANARSDVLDAINDDPVAQAETVQLLREIRDSLIDDSEQSSAAVCIPSDSDASSPQ